MEIRLGENIKAFRKERSLTQEQLAEVLGVTVGAVYKWEAKLSTPELSLIVEMADFFDTSVDVLLGYEMKDNHLDAMIARLWKLNSEKDRSGIAEAEKALKKYPHNLQIVCAGAFMYMHFGEEDHDRKMLQRSLELMETALKLFAQNTDPMGDRLVIYQNMASVYVTLGETGRAVEVLRKHNPGGIFNDWIGMILAVHERQHEEALPCLSHALLLMISTLIRISLGFAAAFRQSGDDPSAEAVLEWGLDCLSGVKNPGRPSYIDRISSVFHVCLAGIRLKTEKDREAAEASLDTAIALARQFDLDPNYHPDSFRFVTDTEWTFVATDTLGKTAMESVEKTVEMIADEELSALWKEMREQQTGGIS